MGMLVQARAERVILDGDRGDGVCETGRRNRLLRHFKEEGSKFLGMGFVMGVVCLPRISFGVAESVQKLAGLLECQ